MRQLPAAEARSIALASARADGFGLIEVLVSALIVVALGATVAQALIVGAFTSSDQRKRSQAAEVDQQDQQRLRGLSSAQLNGLDNAPQVRVVTLDGTPFTVTSTARFLSSTGGSACGSSGAGAAAYYKTTSTSNWPGNTRSAVTSGSLVTPPAGGTLLTQVQDQTLDATGKGAPIPGVTVAASGPAPATGTVAASGSTDAGGCAVFPGLQSGDYTLALTAAGYVDKDGNSPLASSAVVTSVGTANPSSGNPLIMGLAGTVNANFTTVPVLATVTGQQAPGLSWLGTGASRSMNVYKSSLLSPAGTPPSVCGPGSASCSLGSLIPASGTISLFPFAFVGNVYTNNYRAWAGGCRQEEAPDGYDTYTVGPGSNQTLAVQEPALNLMVSSGTVLTRVQPADVRLTFTSTNLSGPACTDTWTPAIAAGAAPINGSLLYPGQPFVNGPALLPVSASGYTGTLTVCADSSASGTMRFANVTTTNANFASATPVIVTIPTSGFASRGSC
jgi:type II secretory pathway pseudopilin PulG